MGRMSPSRTQNAPGAAPFIAGRRSRVVHALLPIQPNDPLVVQSEILIPFANANLSHYPPMGRFSGR